MVVAIDGPSGVGKSTVARAVADALGLPYLDTGAYYRIVTLRALRDDADPDDGDAVLEAVAETVIDFYDGVVTVDGEDVTAEIRSPEVTAAVSTVAAHPSVRSRVVELQRTWVREHGGNAVVEGRDIGTVVFPDADTKVFLTADLETRALRRAGDPEADGTHLAELVEQLQRRDAADSSRAVSPLRPADDAVLVDTTDASVVEVVTRVLSLVGSV